MDLLLTSAASQNVIPNLVWFVCHVLSKAAAGFCVEHLLDTRLVAGDAVLNKFHPQLGNQGKCVFLETSASGLSLDKSQESHDLPESMRDMVSLKNA